MANPDSLEGMTDDDIRKLARWGKAVLGHKETRTEALKLTQKVDPNFQHPELATRALVDEAVAPLRAENDKLRKDLQEQQIRTDRDNLRTKCKGQGFDLEIVEKCMTDNHIGDYDAAMRYLRAESQLAAASSPEISSGNADLPAGFKDIQKNPARWARNQAAQVIKEFRSGVASAA